MLYMCKQRMLHKQNYCTENVVWQAAVTYCIYCKTFSNKFTNIKSTACKIFIKKKLTASASRDFRPPFFPWFEPTTAPLNSSVLGFDFVETPRWAGHCRVSLRSCTDTAVSDSPVGRTHRIIRANLEGFWLITLSGQYKEILFWASWACLSKAYHRWRVFKF